MGDTELHEAVLVPVSEAHMASKSGQVNKGRGKKCRAKISTASTGYRNTFTSLPFGVTIKILIGNS